jgi:PAS domain S-box-containing protein
LGRTPGEGAGLYCCWLVDALGVALIEGLDDAVVVTDASLTVVAWNAVMERLSGVARQDAIGRPAVAALAFLRDVDVASYLQRAVRGVRCSTGDVRFEIGDRAGWVEARYAPWQSANGVGGVVGTHVDVTERRQRATFVRALEAIGQSLTSSLDLKEVLDSIVTHALEVMWADAALVVSWDGQAQVFTVMRAAGRLSDEYAAKGCIPVGGGPISRAILQGTVVTTSNILADAATWLSSERRAQIEREGYKAVAAAPLRSNGRVHGALVVHYWSERVFDAQDVAALRLLAEHAALAIDNARLYADATRRAQRLRELAELEQLVGESLVVDDVLRRIAQATARLLDAPVVQVWTADPQERVLHLSAASVEPGSPEVRMPRTVPFGQGNVGRTAETKTQIYVDNIAEDPRSLASDWARETGIVRMLAVPVLAGDDLLGVLTVRSRHAGLSTDENRSLATSFAARAAVAMQHARTYAEAVRRAGRLRDLVAVSHSITASLDSSDVMQRIARAAAAMTPGALAAVHVFDADANMLRARGLSGGEWDGLPPERAAADGLPGLVVEARAPVLIPQPGSHPRTMAPEWWQRRPRATYYGVPINVGETFVGVLDYILPEGLPDTEEQEALRLLAAQAGIAIRNAGLYQAERVQAERIRTLAGVNQRLSGALELDDLLRTISQFAAQITGVRFVSFWLADEQARTLSFMGGSVPEIAATFPSPTVSYDSGGIGWVARHHQTLVLDDVRLDARVLHPEWWARWNLRSYVAWPVIAGNELLAILSLTHPEPIVFTDDMRDIIEMFLAQAAVAVQNARLFQEARRRRDVAESLARVARELTGTLEEGRIAELVAQGVVELLRTRGATLYRFEPETGRLIAFSNYGPHAEITRGLVLEPGEGVAGRSVTERKIIATPDVLREPGVDITPALRARLERFGTGAVVSVPLVAHDRIVGALSLSDVAGRQFTADELQVLQVFADQAALALENARLYESAQDSLVRLRDTQAQLVQAAKMSAIGQLVSGVAHELNNPLSVIIGYGQLLLARDAPAAVKRPVELMVTQGERMSKIVRNLLYFARQRPPERAAVNVRQVMEQTLALRINQLTLSKIAVTKDFAADVPLTTGDAQQLEQVFLNLLLNAEQAILETKPQGEITLRTRLREDGGTIIAQVIDDGAGIPPESTPRVFEPFYTTKTVGMGTGLGLAVSYGIVQEHGGRLSVESAPGATVFTVELPVIPPPEPEPIETEHRVVSGVGKVALVVEDEAAVLDLIVTLLGESGWRVDVAAGGRAAFQRLREHRYDLVVSDMRMPEGDGEEFYRNALAHDADYGRRFIFITGDTATPRAWAFLEGTDVPVVEKPFQPKTFEDAVYRVVSPV